MLNHFLRQETGMQNGSKRKQRGATFLGMMTIVAILGLGAYAGIRLVPLYLDNMAVVKAMKDIANQMQGGPATPAAIRKALDARWTTDYISSVAVNDIEITPVANGMEMRAAYEGRAPFIGNISFAVEFDKAVVISNRGDR
jgi:hypothetical protein